MIRFEMLKAIYLLVLSMPYCLNQESEEVITLEKVRIVNYTGPFNEHMLGTYFDRVENLQIQSSNISDLTKSTLKLLSKLENLTISDSTIHKSEDDVFVDCCPTLRNLKVNNWLNFKDEDLQGIGLLPLESLIITHQKLPQLGDDIFKNFDLKSLSLDNNGIKNLSNGVFDDLHQLESLSISWNELDEIPKDALAPLKKLRSLYLETDKFDRFSLLNLTFLPELKEIFLTKKKMIEVNLWRIEEKAPKLKDVFLIGDDKVRKENNTGPTIHY